VDSPQVIHPRSREKKKVLRELGYKKYLKQAKVLSLPFNWLEVKDSLFENTVLVNHKRLAALANLLGTRPLYSKETVAEILVVLKKNNPVSEERVKATEDYFGKRIKVIFDGEEQGLLVGLKDGENRFLGIGILQGVDYKRRLLKIYTPVTEKVHSLCFGQIRLNKNCKEIGLSNVCCSGFQ
jgi:polynucleotide 5'-kinase involved in rRNA processing